MAAMDLVIESRLTFPMLFVTAFRGAIDSITENDCARGVVKCNHCSSRSTSQCCWIFQIAPGIPVEGPI